jgi:phosphatidylcholine synthase
MMAHRRHGAFARFKKSVDAEPATSPPAPGGPSPLIRFLAWCVHLYTALGLVIAGLIAVILVQGGPAAFRNTFALMLLATIIDATDGTLARLIKIKSVLPHFDGRKLDDITDFLTYTFLPLLLIWRAEILPSGTEAWLLFPLLASAYGFCQEEAKTDDGYFLGFPSLWNVVAFYLYAMQLPGPLALAVVIVLAVMTFVPSRYLYPSQPGLLNVVSNLLGAVWTVLLVVILWRLPAGSESGIDPATWNLTLVSLFYPVFYMVASWVVTLSHWRNRPHPRFQRRRSERSQHDHVHDNHNGHNGDSSDREEEETV